MTSKRKRELQRRDELRTSCSCNASPRKDNFFDGPPEEGLPKRAFSEDEDEFKATCLINPDISEDDADDNHPSPFGSKVWRMGAASCVLCLMGRASICVKELTFLAWFDSGLAYKPLTFLGARMLEGGGIAPELVYRLN